MECVYYTRNVYQNLRDCKFQSHVFTLHYLPVEYYANSSAWMAADIFNEYLMKEDNILDHKIVLLVDNCTTHSVNVLLKNIKVVYIPANTTVLIQPYDHRIISTLKAYYH